MRGFFKIIRFNIPILLLALFSVFLHLAFINNLEYHRDELLYFSLGLHPDFGYATVPPMIGWVAWIMQNIFGYSLFAVRLFPAIISGIMVLIVADIAIELGGKQYASILSSIGMIITIFGLRTFSLFMPVHLDILFWTFSFYLIIKYINSENDKYLFWFGILAGLSMLNKYLIALLFLAILVVILFTRYRNVFKKKMFWFGMVAGSIIFLPNLIWQILHGLPVINHLSELGRTQLVNVDRLGFLQEQLISPGAASILTIAGLLYLFINKNAVKFRFLGVITILIIVTLFLLRGKSYYTIGLFPFLIAAGAVSAEKILRKIWSQIILIVFLVLFTLPIIPFGLPVYKTKGLVNYFKELHDKYGANVGRRWEDGSVHSLPQDYADMLGWEELTMITNRAWHSIADNKAAFIYCENYGQAGAITIIGKKYGLPEAVSFNESFRYWIPHKFDPDITSFIYINNDEMGEDVRTLFRKITIIGSITNPDAREYGTTVYLCEDPVMSFNKFWKARLALLETED